MAPLLFNIFHLKHDDIEYQLTALAVSCYTCGIIGMICGMIPFVTCLIWMHERKPSNCLGR